VIVVDTSVWIDLLNGSDTPKANRCAEMIEDGAPIALTDVVLTEILQGFRTDREASSVETSLRRFPILRLQSVDDFVIAARLYRIARRAGITIHKTIDCLIAAACVRAGAPLFHDDKDFDRLASCTDLEVFA